MFYLYTLLWEKTLKTRSTPKTKEQQTFSRPHMKNQPEILILWYFVFQSSLQNVSFSCRSGPERTPDKGKNKKRNIFYFILFFFLVDVSISWFWPIQERGEINIKKDFSFENQQKRCTDRHSPDEQRLESSLSHVGLRNVSCRSLCQSKTSPQLSAGPRWTPTTRHTASGYSVRRFLYDE